MAINQWRYVRYTDDGCGEYQCLKCYDKWEARSTPGYVDFETKAYVPIWKFCPCCGTKWDGMRLTNPDRDADRQLGPRRRRIQEAIDRLTWDHDLRRREPTFYWVIEEFQEARLKDRVFGHPGEWRAAFHYHDYQLSAAKALGVVRDHLRVLEAQHADRFDDADEIDDFRLTWTCQTRLRVVKAADFRSAAAGYHRSW